ncbi:hypothetical protein Acr_00g0085750 [Actinidia rufa]|uniref:Smr domain-containing protein n=1 Tax=Actinidia rufa TaxID=165716 RepID=A0A7J0DVW5_9ERIC|nr:hypothetical protein Acr_00g0085750 [Actinidia rufa]
MSFSKIRAPTNDKKLINSGKVTTLNPNAAEFIPFALRSSSESTSTAEASTNLGVAGVGTLGKAVLDRSGSSISNTSDEEAHQYWRRQLPDDITPDFKVMGEDESQGINGIPFSMLSLHDGNETSRFSASMGSGFVLKGQHELPSRGINGNSVTEKMRYPVPSYGEDVSSTNFLHLPTKPWDKSIVDNDQTSLHSITENTEMNFLEFLAMQFPDFAAGSLAEVYFANGGDLNLTIEMLTRLELQVDGDGQSGLPKYAGNEMGKSVSSYQSASNDNMVLFKSSSSIPSRGAIDFASAVRKMSSQDSNTWKYERNGSADASVGSSRSVMFWLTLTMVGRGGVSMGISYKVGVHPWQLLSGLKLEKQWMAANMYSEEEARDHARLQNAYFAQMPPLHFVNYTDLPYLQSDDLQVTKRAGGSCLGWDSVNWQIFDLCLMWSGFYRNSEGRGLRQREIRWVQMAGMEIKIWAMGMHVVWDWEELWWLRGGKRYGGSGKVGGDHERGKLVVVLGLKIMYLGNKALAKELCVKGQLHNMHMKAAHGKAQESIYRQRNPVSPEMQGNVRGQERIIDLHGLHVSEAIQVLKRDLTVLRSAARSVEQRLPVYICVGTGHHTKGSRTPARLPIAVQRYLLEEEGIEYAEPQPGLLRIVLY